METRNIFQNISPLDHRYSLSESEVFNALSAHLSEEAAIKSCVLCEVALVRSHLMLRKILTPALEKVLDTLPSLIKPDDVYLEEEKTHHNIRALVNVMKKKVIENFSPEESRIISPLIHLGATSVDILDTALSLRLKNVTREVVLEELKKLEKSLCEITLRECETPEVGRTHGQHAVPITFGYFTAEFVARLGKSIVRIEELSGELAGKLSGPVGCYNGMSMIEKNPEQMEQVYVGLLKLKASEYSNQLAEPEYVLRLLLEMNVAFGIIANLADDLRNLQRTEIGEVFEYFSSSQVGSSTMPQKRNPWNSEHVKSLWKAMCPRVITFFMDQISEHQRDLTNSASERFIADYIAGFVMALSRMNAVASKLEVDKINIERNLNSGGGRVSGGTLAEPAYILLGEAGLSDAHETVRQITLEAEKTGESFFQVLKKKEDIFEVITKQLHLLGVENAENFFMHPGNYSGLAAKKSKRLAEKYLKLLDL